MGRLIATRAWAGAACQNFCWSAEAVCHQYDARVVAYCAALRLQLDDAHRCRLGAKLIHSTAPQVQEEAFTNVLTAEPILGNLCR